MELGTLPGTLLRPQDLKIGQKVHARDAGRYWYPAEVVETRRGRQPAAYVTYDRFPSTHDEWLSIFLLRARGALRLTMTKIKMVQFRLTHRMATHRPW